MLKRLRSKLWGSLVKSTFVWPAVDAWDGVKVGRVLRGGQTNVERAEMPHAIYFILHLIYIFNLHLILKIVNLYWQKGFFCSRLVWERFAFYFCRVLLIYSMSITKITGGGWHTFIETSLTSAVIPTLISSRNSRYNHNKLTLVIIHTANNNILL